jgi:Fe-S-cluster containining protein
MDKPVDTWCANADPENPDFGCRDYENRPSGCRSFSCAWLRGMGDEDDRPDKLGVMLQPVHHEELGESLAFVEAEPGALRRPRVQRYLSQAVAQAPGRIFIRSYRDPHFKTTQITVNRASIAS